ncbi:MAG: hypothetical protein ACKVS6_14755 [Planctomycetota bacterium]
MNAAILAFPLSLVFPIGFLGAQDPKTPESRPAPVPIVGKGPIVGPGHAFESSPRFATGISGRLRGFPDAAAPALRDLKAGEPFIVVGKQGDLLEVEVPGGLPAWIWAAYVKEGKESGTVVTMEDGVNLRPQPQSDARTVPIARAKKGQTFISVGRKGDWIQVVTPPEVHGFVLASEITITNDPPEMRTAELAAGRKWVDEYKEKTAAAEKLRKAEEEKRLAEEKKRRDEQMKEMAARDKCRQAMDLLKGLANADARARADALLVEASQISRELPEKTAAAVEADITRAKERIEHLTFVEREKKADDAAEEKEREAKLAAALERQKRLEESYQKHKDPVPVDAFGARFAGMGWVRRELFVPQGRMFFIEKGGKLQFFLKCDTGRYNLSDFTGREIGVLGKIKTIEGIPARVIEVDQIEILSNFPG